MTRGSRFSWPRFAGSQHPRGGLRHARSGLSVLTGAISSYLAVFQTVSGADHGRLTGRRPLNAGFQRSHRHPPRAHQRRLFRGRQVEIGWDCLGQFGFVGPAECLVALDHYGVFIADRVRDRSLIPISARQNRELAIPRAEADRAACRALHRNHRGDVHVPRLDEAKLTRP